ncbi:hypothetical protein [Phenylobacterium sp.]|uniref:hypothetical protein n=1 Tax=Phenylobacterium sp. TaxID=1871053 RepID=UPI000C960F22|nr:hypothetical protein [Phenylobacterium sp.]MAK80273.1 hypothetical protein [Phenylobacterium sp.]
MESRYINAVEEVQDYATAVRWVDKAVKMESERLQNSGGLKDPESYLKAEALRAAWKRVQRG